MDRPDVCHSHFRVFDCCSFAPKLFLLQQAAVTGPRHTQAVSLQQQLAQESISSLAACFSQWASRTKVAFVLLQNAACSVPAAARACAQV